jgi:acetylornithine deacetylase/succinyl-diaminopimelate desuccinylase-like protein
VARDPLLAEAEENLAAYLRIDTSNPPGNETNGARFLQQLLAKEGIEAKLLGSDPNRQSLYARLSSGTSEKALVLLHHIDVVPVAANEWTKPPFGGQRSGGYIWGRGALDIKSLGIAELMAFIDLKRRKVALSRDVIYLAVADEELGGTRGCKEILEKNPELFADAGFVLNEAGYNETAVDKVLFWGIEVTQKVPLFVRLHVHGAPGHSASPPADGGAIVKLMSTLQAIQALPAPYRLTPAVDRYFKELAKTRRDEKGEVLRSLREPLDAKRIEAVLPPGYRSLLHDTIAITRVQSGVCPNCLPATAIADIDVRLLDDERVDDMLGRIRAAVPKGVDVEVLLAGEPAPESTTDTPLYRILVDRMKKAEPGSNAAAVVSAGTSDSRFFRQRGVVAYGIAPFKVNYYDADTVHGNDERIRAPFFEQGVQLVRGIVSDFCVKR